MIRNLIRKSSSLNFSTKKRSPIIGIDLGTTNSCVAIMENSKPKMIENSQGMRTTPSVIAFTKDDEVLIGSAAKRQAIINSQKTIYAIKRLLGRRFDQDCVKNFRQDFPYQIIKHQNGDAWIRVKDNNYSPSEISAFILKKMKETVENYLGESVQRAVITVPAYFNDSQRQATIDAGKIAGFHVQRILNEPTAAAMAYGISKKQLDQTIAVYDLGGGTFDISILQISHGVIEVKASNGDTTCGGQDVDTILQKYLLEEFRKISGVDSSQDKAVIQRLREACQRAKKQLSHITQTQINLPFLTSNASGPKHFTYKLTRAKFQSLIEDFLKRTIKPCEQCIRDSQIRINQINEVILVGGMTKMPKVQKLVQKFFGRAPKMSINPDEAVAIGAAIQGGVLMGDFRDLLLIDITPLSLGIQTLGGYMTKIIGKNTTIPAKKSRIFTTAFDNQSKVSIKIYQGQKERVEQNKLLGQFSLRGIEPAPRGTPQIEVTFDIDSNGIVHVGAKDIKTGVTQKAIIENSGNMSEQQINKIIKRFQDIKKGENQRKDLQKLKEQLQFVYQLGKCRLSELKFHVPSEEFSIAKDTFERLGDWRKKNLKLTDIQQLKKLVQQLKVFTEKYLRKQGIKKMQSS